MKNTTIFALVLFGSFGAFAQNNAEPLYAKAANTEKAATNADITSKDVFKKFYNANREEMSSLEGAKFIKIVKKTPKNNWSVNEFYADGFLAMEGSYADAKEEIKHGNFKFYKPKNVLDYEGTFNDDQPDGDWKFYFPNGKISAVETYEKGIKTKDSFWNEDGTVLANKVEATRLIPAFLGGAEKLNMFLKRNVRYPADAAKNKIAGKVIVSFWVDEEGNIMNPKIEQSLNETLDSEVLKVVENMPKWLPAKQHNRAYKQMYILPVAFNFY